MASYGYDINKLEHKRVTKGLTKEKLANLAGIHPSTVSNVLSGRCGTETTIGKIAVALEIDLSDITIPLPEAVQHCEGGM